MLAYDAWLGLRYWDNLGRGTAALAEAKALLASARGPAGITGALEQQLAPNEARLESQTELLSYAHTDELIELVATAARASGVALESVNVAEAGRRAAGPLSYQVLALTVRVSGDTERIYGFVGALSAAAPGMTVRGARLGNLSSAPWASLEIDFQLDPAPNDGGEKTP